MQPILACAHVFPRVMPNAPVVVMLPEMEDGPYICCPVAIDCVAELLQLASIVHLRSRSVAGVCLRLALCYPGGAAGADQTCSFGIALLIMPAEGAYAAGHAAWHCCQGHWATRCVSLFFCPGCCDFTWPCASAAWQPQHRVCAWQQPAGVFGSTAPHYANGLACCKYAGSRVHLIAATTPCGSHAAAAVATQHNTP